MIRRFVASFSTVGLVLRGALFCASLTPSLPPRTPAVQGVLGGFVFGAGYAIGNAAHWLWRFMGFRSLGGRPYRITTWVLVGLATARVVLLVSRLLNRIFPRRVAIVVGGTAFALLMLSFVNIDAWIEVTQPADWSEADTEKLKAHFADFDPTPL